MNGVPPTSTAATSAARGTVGIERRPGAVLVTAVTYLLEVRADPPRAILADRDGLIWSQLSLLASLDRTDAVDESYAVGFPVVRVREDGDVEVVLEMASSAWEAKTVRLVCLPGTVELDLSVRGTGELSDLTLLGGRAVLSNGACGAFRSSIEFQSLFSPAPSEPVQVVRPATSAAVLGVVGDAGAGRLHGIFSPPPLCIALGRHLADGPTDVPAGRWLAVAVRAPVAEMTFTQLRYAPVDGGFLLHLDYDGHTRVDGEFRSPTLVMGPTGDPWQALGDSRADLLDRGLAAPGPVHPPAMWWQEPIFCGWGAQCARAPLPGEPASHPYYLADLGPAVVPPGHDIASDMARQEVYDELLLQLAEYGIVPGTVVIDDRWQAAYGTAEPHPERWPDLRSWIAERHAVGQKVLLWWKAWAWDGLPADECVLDAGGRPVAVDPGNPAYLRHLADIVTRLVSPAGLDADGFKVDFTQRAPAGHSLQAYTDKAARPGVWGIAALHALLDTLYRAAKAAKADALVVTHTPHPGFADVCDMVRLNDILERDPLTHCVPVVDQLRFRHAVVTASMPGHPIDTDQWPMPNRDEWRSYVQLQGELGVPALYYADSIDRSRERLSAQDLALVAQRWHAYRRRVGLTR